MKAEGGFLSFSSSRATRTFLERVAGAGAKKLEPYYSVLEPTIAQKISLISKSKIMVWAVNIEPLTAMKRYGIRRNRPGFDHVSRAQDDFTYVGMGSD